MKLPLLDTLIVLVYLAGVFALAQWVSREKAGHEKTAKDYFLASKSLPWWAIGASLIAANISAEQIIGMSGSGYALGLALSSTAVAHARGEYRTSSQVDKAEVASIVSRFIQTILPY